MGVVTDGARTQDRQAVRMMLLIPYDSSPASHAAITRAAERDPGAHVVILTVWDVSGKALSTVRMDQLALGFAAAQAANERAARQLAQQGTAQARAAGLDAVGLTAPLHSSVAETIVTVTQLLAPVTLVVGDGDLAETLAALIAAARPAPAELAVGPR